MPERSCTETEMIRRKRRFSCRTGGPMEHCRNGSFSLKNWVLLYFTNIRM
jgi:hypothetical protein